MLSWQPTLMTMAASSQFHTCTPTQAQQQSCSTTSTAHSVRALETHSQRLCNINLDSPRAASDSDDSSFELVDPSEATLSGKEQDIVSEEGSYGAFAQATQWRDRLDLVYNHTSSMDADNSNDYNSPEWQQAGRDADSLDLAGPGAHGRLECTVSKPQKEGEGTQNAYISYAVTTEVRGLRSAHVQGC